MGNWGSDLFGSTQPKNTNEKTLHGVIQSFPASLKQAMFAAASRGPIKRQTWQGCAMNAAGFEVGTLKEVRSVQAAALSFGVSEGSVNTFIQCWDRLQGTDEECTQRLRTMIEDANLFAEPGHKPPRIVRVKVYENQQKKLREQFDSLMEANMIPDEEVAHGILVGAVAD